MNRGIGLASIVTILSTGHGIAFGRSGTQLVPLRSVSIRLYDQAQVSDSVLRLSTGEADELFRRARIQTDWAFPSIQPPEDQGLNMTSSPYLRSAVRPYVAVRITRRTPASLLPGALGFALPFARAGANVVIFYDRVEALASRENKEISLVFGYAMAHELGHVLLGSSEHARGGLMQAQVTSETLRLAAAGLLVFTREETERMRARWELLQIQQVKGVEAPNVDTVALNLAGSE